jgi:hypothetical protein
MAAAKIANMRQGERTDMEPSADLRKVGQGERTDMEPSANLPKVDQAEAAKQLNVGERTVREAKKVQKDGTPVLGKLAEAGGGKPKKAK